MDTLITSGEVIEIAFAVNDQIDPSILTKARIEAAQLKFLAPALGHLYPALIGGKYEEFNREYIKPALAHFVRYAILPHLGIHLGNRGISHPKSIDAYTATPTEVELLRREARESAYRLLDRAIRFLRENAEAFAEFCPETLGRRKVRVNGGLIL